MNRSGFTLIELLIIIGIIGILVSAAVIAFGGPTDGVSENCKLWDSGVCLR